MPLLLLMCQETVSDSSGRFVRLYLGVRRHEIKFDNHDLLVPSHSFDRWPGVTSPKANITFGNPNSLASALLQLRQKPSTPMIRASLTKTPAW